MAKPLPNHRPSRGLPRAPGVEAGPKAGPGAGVIPEVGPGAPPVLEVDPGDPPFPEVGLGAPPGAGVDPARALPCRRRTARTSSSQTSADR